MLKRNSVKSKDINPIYDIMKNRNIKLLLALLLVLTGSCNEPKTIVTDIIHADGSVLRKLEMRNSQNSFKVKDIQVPYDSTWTTRDSMEINAAGDTTWVRRAEKLYKSAEELNRDYKADSSANRHISRRVEFGKKFRWFNTEFTYAEIIDNKLLHGYPVEDFLTGDEIKWFYSPYNLNEEKEKGPDSLKYRAFNDTVKSKVEKWTVRCFVSEWIFEFARLASDKRQISADSLKLHEDDYYRIIGKYDKDFDSLWSNGTILREMIGEVNANRFRNEADSAIKIVTDRFFINFSDYTVRTRMPGKLTLATGLIDSAGFVNWPVKSDYFLAKAYIMKAESKVPNLWAWIVSGIFMLFVFTGILLRKTGKG